MTRLTFLHASLDNAYSFIHPFKVVFCHIYTKTVRPMIEWWIPASWLHGIHLIFVSVSSAAHSSGDLWFPFPSEVDDHVNPYRPFLTIIVLDF